MTIGSNSSPPEKFSTSYRYLLGILFLSIILLLSIAIAIGSPKNFDECITRCDAAHKHKVVLSGAWLDCERHCLNKFKTDQR